MANEVRLIDGNKAEAVLRNIADHLREAGNTDLYPATYAAADVIKQQRTIDPESLRPKGRWAAINADCRGYANAFECSNCETISHTHTYMKECEFEYCPVCGAKMEG